MYIEHTLNRISKKIWEKIEELVIIDDGSSDKTKFQVEKLSKKWRKITLLHKDKNEGYARAQKTGFSYALTRNADCIALLHSDGQYAPELLGALLRPIESGNYDIVQGSRILGGKALDGGMPLYKFIANIALSKMENIVFGLNIAEYHSGYMLYSKKALNEIAYMELSNTFHFDGEMMLVGSKKGLRVLQLPIPTKYSSEKSSLKPIPYGFTVLKVMLDYYLGKYDKIISHRSPNS